MSKPIADPYGRINPPTVTIDPVAQLMWMLSILAAFHWPDVQSRAMRLMMKKLRPSPVASQDMGIKLEEYPSTCWKTPRVAGDRVDR